MRLEELNSRPEPEWNGGKRRKANGSINEEHVRRFSVSEMKEQMLKLEDLWWSGRKRSENFMKKAENVETSGWNECRVTDRFSFPFSFSLPRHV